MLREMTDSVVSSGGQEDAGFSGGREAFFLLLIGLLGTPDDGAGEFPSQESVSNQLRSKLLSDKKLTHGQLVEHAEAACWGTRKPTEESLDAIVARLAAKSQDMGGSSSWSARPELMLSAPPSYLWRDKEKREEAIERIEEHLVEEKSKRSSLPVAPMVCSEGVGAEPCHVLDSDTFFTILLRCVSVKIAQLLWTAVRCHMSRPQRSSTDLLTSLLLSTLRGEEERLPLSPRYVERFFDGILSPLSPGRAHDTRGPSDRRGQYTQYT